LGPILALMITNCFQNFNSNGIVNILCMSLYSKNKMSMYRFFYRFSPTFSPYKTNLRPYYILLFVLVKKWWLVINQFLCFSVLLVFYYYSQCLFLWIFASHNFTQKMQSMNNKIISVSCIHFAKFWMYATKFLSLSKIYITFWV